MEENSSDIESVGPLEDLFPACSQLAMKVNARWPQKCAESFRSSVLLRRTNSVAVDFQSIERWSVIWTQSGYSRKYALCLIPTVPCV